MEKLTLIDLDLAALQARIRSWGEPYDGARTYARHIWHWLYHDLGTSIHELEALPPTLRERLSQELPLITPGLLAQEVSPDLSTQKHLLQMTDGVQVESVLLAYRDRFTVCASTQVGCACGCDFCATGKMGFVDNSLRARSLPRSCISGASLAPRTPHASRMWSSWAWANPC